MYPAAQVCRSAIGSLHEMPRKTADRGAGVALGHLRQPFLKVLTTRLRHGPRRGGANRRRGVVAEALEPHGHIHIGGAFQMVENLQPVGGLRIGDQATQADLVVAETTRHQRRLRQAGILRISVMEERQQGVFIQNFGIGPQNEKGATAYLGGVVRRDGEWWLFDVRLLGAAVPEAAGAPAEDAAARAVAPSLLRRAAGTISVSVSPRATRTDSHVAAVSRPNSSTRSLKMSPVTFIPFVE